MPSLRTKRYFYGKLYLGLGYTLAGIVEHLLVRRPPQPLFRTECKGQAS